MIKNFHVPLPLDMYDLLTSSAKEKKVPATKLVRNLIEVWLKQRRRKKNQDEFKNFARKYAGTKFDLDEDLEQVSLEFLNSLDI